MLELEVVVVVVGLRTEAISFHDDLRLVRLQLLGLFFLLVEELLVIGDAGIRAVRPWARSRSGRVPSRPPDAVRRGSTSPAAGERCPHQTHLGNRDLFVDAVGILLFGRPASEAGGLLPVAGLGLLFPGVNGLGGNGFGAAIIVTY